MVYITEDYGWYYIYNYTYECAIRKDRLVITELIRPDSSGVYLINCSAKDRRVLRYQMEDDDTVLEYNYEFPIYQNPWKVGYFYIGSALWVQGIQYIQDWAGNNIEIVLNYIFEESVDNIKIHIAINSKNSNNRLRWATFKDTYLVNFESPQIFRSMLQTIDDFSSYSNDTELRTAWHNNNVTLYLEAIPDDNGTSSHGISIPLSDTGTALIWRSFAPNGLNLKKSTASQSLPELSQAGLYFATKLYHTSNQYSFIPLRTRIYLLEDGADNHDGEWKQVGDIDCIARPVNSAGNLWESHWLPWPSNIDLSSIQAIRFIFDSPSTDHRIILDDIRYLKYHNETVTTQQFYHLGMPHSGLNARNQTSDFLIYAYNRLQPFDAIGLVGRWDCSKALGIGYQPDHHQNLLQIENVLVRHDGDEYSLSADWELWTYHSSGPEGYWNFASILLNRQKELANYQT